MIDEVQETYAADGTLLTYGALSPLDSMLGALAILPDFVNPAIFNMGYMTALQSKLFKTASWPVQLIAISNGAAGPAELSYMLRKTVYEFLDPSILVHVDQDTNYSSLLLRHWVYLYYKTLPTRVPEVFPVAGVARKVAQVQFTINGKLQLETRRWSFQVHDLFVISLLSFLKVPDVLSWVQGVNLPDMNMLSEQLIFFVQNFFWRSLPPNYNDVTPHLRNLDGTKTLVVSAPTGSGKSTAFVNHCKLTVGHKFNKIIVVEPRSTIVKTIVPFVNQALAMDSSGATSGMTLRQDAKVWYVTAQELLLHPSWYSGQVANNLIILDECHVSEPAYDLVKDILVKENVNRVFVSATPDFSQLDASKLIDIPLVSARLYTVHTSVVTQDDILTLNDFTRHYTSDVMSMIHSRPLNSVILVFCTTLAMCNQFSELCPRKSYVLSSGTNTIPAVGGGYVIFSTSVADVGITLPDVDLVITSDIGFTVLNTLEKSIPSYYRLNDSDLKQRAGRTGRTNNGSAVIFKTPRARFVSDISDLKNKTSAFDLIASGMPLDSIIQLRGNEVKELLGLTDVDPARAEATLNNSLFQLNLYRSNLEPLLNERAKMLEIGTNDGSVSHPIDNARMGILLETTKVPTSHLIQAILTVVKHLGLRSTANQAEAEVHNAEIRKASAVLLGNIKSRLPFPDPDLGEWGMTPDDTDDFYRFVGRTT
uniref:175 kDa protein n=1 Tax=Dali Fusar tick virus 1 TaxID=2972104 RepID=A0A9E8A9B9_9VIRU|nr:MAG: 175 kDa protein [Dali Fusar tick virus 1]